MTLKDGVLKVFREFRDELSRQLNYELSSERKKEIENEFIEKSTEILAIGEKVYSEEFSELAKLEKVITPTTKHLLKEYMVVIIVDSLSKEDPKSVSIEEVVTFKLAALQSLQFFRKIAGDLQNRRGPLDEYSTFTTLN